jgi:hypothetical protein
VKATVALSLAIISGLGIFAAWQHDLIARQNTKIESLNNTVDALQKAARLKVSLAAGTEVDPKGPRGLGDLVPPDTSPDSSPDKSKDKAPDASPGGVMAEMMKNPAARDALKAQTRAQLENEYRDLFDSLGLDETTTDAVMKLIADRAFAQMDSAFAMSSGSPEEKAAAAATLKAESAKAEAALKEKLGPNYASFEKFEKSAPERQQLKMVKSAFKDKGLDFDEATEAKLMDSLYETRSNWKFEHDYSNPANLSPDSLNEEALNRYAEENAKMQESVESKVREFLSPEQLDAFRSAQKQQQEMMQLGLKMSRGMFGSAPPQKGD